MEQEPVQFNPVLQLLIRGSGVVITKQHLPIIRELERRVGPLRGPNSYVTIIRHFLSINLLAAGIALMPFGEWKLSLCALAIWGAMWLLLRDVRYEPAG